MIRCCVYLVLYKLPKGNNSCAQILFWEKVFFFFNLIKQKGWYVAGFSLSNYIRAAGGLWLDREKGGGAKSYKDSMSEGREEKMEADMNQHGFNQPQVVMIS